MHTHTHSMSQLMKWEAEIPLQTLFCSDYTVTDRNKENEFNDTKSYELGGDGSNGCILPTGIMIRCFFILSSSCHPLYVQPVCFKITNDIM